MAKKILAVLLAVMSLTAGSIIPLRNAPSFTPNAVGTKEAGLLVDASGLVDQIMANVRVMLLQNGLDVIPIPPYKDGFSVTILGITWHGELELSNGHIDGLATLHRTGVADITPEPNGDYIVTADVGLNDCGISSGILVKFMGLGPDGSVSGYLKNVRVELKLRLSAVSETQFKVKLEKFNIKDLGTLSIDIKGLGAILNLVAEAIANVVGNLIKGIVADLLQGIIKDIVNSIIDQLLPGSGAMAINGFGALGTLENAPEPVRMPSKYNF